jgi:hypothetical protein
MLLHIDGSRHRWFQDERWYDLIVILDDASSEIYYAQLVEEESTLTVMAGLKEVIQWKGVFCALYPARLPPASQALAGARGVSRHIGQLTTNALRMQTQPRLRSLSLPLRKPVNVGLRLCWAERRRNWPSGTFNMSDTGEKWKRFTSTQRVIAQRPGFDWEAARML